MQGDLDAGVHDRTGGFTPPEDAPPLQLNEFKIPKSMPLEIPRGAEVSPDLSQIRLPDDMEVALPDDLDLSDLSFELPEDFTLSLPPGTEFSAPDLALPEGASIVLPDGRRIQVPAGSELTLPPELVQRLLAEGVAAGTLDEGRDIRVSDLPPGLEAQLDPPAFDGAGSLRLPAGTTITLPDGSRFPFAAGALAYAARYLLPAGTTFDLPFDALGGSGTLPVPVPAPGTPLADERGASRTPVETEITSMPARVRKGDPVTVSGYVRVAGTMRGVAGAPVDVFMNESKRVPGVLVGQGTTDASGTFVIKLVLPADKPARDYQLVNHAAAFVATDGRAYADGWGDPPFATYAGTSLALQLPAKDGLGASTTIAGTLLDNTGAGVAGATVVVSVDGTIVARPITNAAGLWSVQHTFAAGVHSVAARFAGTANYEASNTATGTITIEDYAIRLLAPVLYAKPGEGIQLRGDVLYKGRAADARTVLVKGVFDAGDVELVSNLDGSFSYAFSTARTQPPGTYTLTYTLPAHGATKTQQVILNQTGTLALDAPDQWDLDRPVPVAIRLASPENVGIRGQDVRITISGPGGSRDAGGVTDARGAMSTELAPLRAAPGVYTLSARVVGSPSLDAPTVTKEITLGSFEVTWSLPESVVRGQEIAGSATLRLAGAPFTQPVSLDLFGPSQATPDTDGIIRFRTIVPTVASLGPHTVTVAAIDHAPRETKLLVVALPRLALDVPTTYEPGRAPEAALTLTDDQGDPIRNAQVDIRLVGATAEHARLIRTDGEGRWRGPLDITEHDGNVTLTARFEGSGSYLAGEEVRTLSAAAAQPLVGGSWWLLPLVGAVLAGSGGLLWWHAKRRPRAAPAEAVAADAPLAAPPARPSEIDLAFGIAQDEPAVWGANDPLELHARNRGERGSFRLAWPGGATELALDAGGHAGTTLTFPDEGEVSIEARRAGGEFAPAEASVRIVDYRKETAREFDILLEKARAIDGSLTKRSTPREIAWTLAGRLGRDAEPALDEVALVLEVTNYSHYAVSREHYLRFVRAARALDPLLAPPTQQGG